MTASSPISADIPPSARDMQKHLPGLSKTQQQNAKAEWKIVDSTGHGDMLQKV
jgi:hypothetical protein